MRTISYSEARRKLATTMDQVNDDHAPIIITRQRAKPAVLISLDDYNSMEETAYLLRSPANAKRLTESIKQLEAGKGRERKLRE